MNKKDILELKHRMKKTHCTFTHMCGCYVNAEKEIVLTFDENFLNLEEEELHKYLEIAAKTLSGTPKDNLLELAFPKEAEDEGGKQQFLMGLKESKLKNHELVMALFRLVIDNYEYEGNYLILLFHDAYDVMKKTNDNLSLDESEEVYEYLLCAICPVTLSKAALGYLENDHRIGARKRDWVVGAPDTGFVFPAFTERSTDIHSVLYYTRDTKSPHNEFMECVLGCPARQTATEKKTSFQDIVTSAVPDERGRERVLYDIHETLQEMVEEQALYTEDKKEPDPIVLTPKAIQEVLIHSKVPDEIAARIENSYTEKFTDEPPVADLLVDKKLLNAGAQARREEELRVEMQQLKDELGHTKNELILAQNTAKAISDFADTNLEAASSQTEEPEMASEFDVLLRVAPQKADQITTQIIGGRRCVIIPIEENEHIKVNGEELAEQTKD